MAGTNLTGTCDNCAGPRSNRAAGPYGAYCSKPACVKVKDAHRATVAPRAAHDYVCDYCAVAFVSRNVRRSYCYEPTCERAHRAKKQREGGYSARYEAKYGKKTYAKPRSCDFCAQQFDAKKASVKYCGYECARLAINGVSNSTTIAVPLRPRAWAGQVLSPSSPGFVAGACTYCGANFVGGYGSRYCSDKCSTNSSWKRRYDRKGMFRVTDLVRSAIYVRDGWTCQLCFEPVDPALPTQDRMGHTLDHIVPQSHQLVPDHSPSNLRLAHRLCNSVRGDGSREVRDAPSATAMRDVRGLQASPAS